MTGLKRYARDAGLTERLGDPRLVPPDPAVVVAWLRCGLLSGEASAPCEASWEFARWKPGVSITCVYAVTFADGAAELVALKRYRSDKATHLMARSVVHDDARDGADERGGAGPRLRGRAFADDATILWAPADDRELPGLARLLDPRRAARWLDEAGVVPPRSVRRRRTAYELLRYKPERRAVARLDLSLREGPDAARSFAVRVLPLAAAGRMIVARRALLAAAPDEAPGTAPDATGAPVVPMLLALPELGIVFEPWLPVTAFASDEFEHAEVAGRALARLHAVAPAPGRSGGLKPRDMHAAGAGARRLLARFHVDADDVASPRDEPRAWTHGDLHPDQIALDASGTPILMDMDELGPGDPRRDLASWVADHLAADPNVELHAACAPLSAGYGAGCTPEELAPFVADELVRRAAGVLRRLEVGALARARDLVARAAGIAARTPGGPGTRRSVRLADALTTLAARTQEVDAAQRVARADVSREGEICLTLDDEPARWFRYDADGLLELDPARDPQLPLGPRLAEPGHRLLAWRPGRRIVLHAGDVILKGHRRKRLAAAVRAHASAALLNSVGGFRVPALCAVREDDSALALEILAGAPLRVAADHSEAFRRVGVRLRAMQAHSTEGLEHFGTREELGVLARWRGRLASVAVAPVAGWERALGRLEVLADELPSARLVPCHRDLHDRQLLVMDDDIALLDFDLLCAADPALDAGNLIAHLHLRALQGLDGADDRSARYCVGALLSGLACASEPGFAARLAFYTATSSLRLALVYALRPRWRGVLPALVARAEPTASIAPREVSR